MAIDSRNFVGVKGTTPVGEVVWAQIASPSKKFKPDGEFLIRLRIQSEHAQSLIDEMKKVIAEKYEDEKRACKNPRDESRLKYAPQCWEREFDASRKETGFIMFRFKSSASGVTPDGREWTRTIPVFDTKGEPVVQIPDIGPGSKLKVSYELRGYNSPALGVGCSCRLHAVQLFNLSPRKENRTAEDYGFSRENASLESHASLESQYLEEMEALSESEGMTPYDMSQDEIPPWDEN